MENEQHQGPNLETEIASYKNSTVARKTTSRRLKHFLGFVSILVDLQSEFMKRVIAVSLI